MRNGSQFNRGSLLDIEHLMYLYFSSGGRINRQRNWPGRLVLGLISMPAYIISVVFFTIVSFLSVLSVLINHRCLYFNFDSKRHVAD